LSCVRSVPLCLARTGRGRCRGPSKSRPSGHASIERKGPARLIVASIS
jgi:hypothetical protein